MSEFDLIWNAFLKGAPRSHTDTSVVNGDDASVHTVPEGMELVISTDTSIIDVHWPRDIPLDMAADRAVCASLSDLAAMGAEARWAWVSVVSPDAELLEEIGNGINEALNRYRVELAGGDTTRGPAVVLTITVGGVVPKGKAMIRGAANDDDSVWMVGRAGFASLGLQQWLAGMDEGYFKPYFAEVKPKLELGIKLRELGVRCCIDVSDGVLADAGHIAEASGVGMELELLNFPGWEKLCHKVGNKSAIEAVAGGGEDYALIFTAPKVMNWLDSFAFYIGRCTQSGHVELFLDGNKINELKPGYDHFA